MNVNAVCLNRSFRYGYQNFNNNKFKFSLNLNFSLVMNFATRYLANNFCHVICQKQKKFEFET